MITVLILYFIGVVVSYLAVGIIEYFENGPDVYYKNGEYKTDETYKEFISGNVCFLSWLFIGFLIIGGTFYGFSGIKDKISFHPYFFIKSISKILRKKNKNI